MTQDHEDFIQRAGFREGWVNLESWARRMADQAIDEIEALERTVRVQKNEIQTLRAENLELRTNVVEKALHNGDQLTELKQLRAKLAKYEEAEKQEPVGVLHLSSWRQSQAYQNHEFEFFATLPDGSYDLYARPAPIPHALTELKRIYAKMTNCESFGEDGEVRGQMVPHALLDELGAMLTAAEEGE